MTVSLMLTRTSSNLEYHHSFKHTNTSRREKQGGANTGKAFIITPALKPATDGLPVLAHFLTALALWGSESSGRICGGVVTAIYLPLQLPTVGTA